MMVVAHNLLAMNGDRMLGINSKAKAKSTEKLSSGYRVNRAADDAAGLAISEKLRRQIRGLSQGAKNIQDGISLVQIAEGALNETQDILQRMNELAVKAANGTNQSEDREYLQKEIGQLIGEVDHIANTTSFNDAVYPLAGRRENIEIKTEGIPNIAISLLKNSTETIEVKEPEGLKYNDIFYPQGSKIVVNGITTDRDVDKLWWECGYYGDGDYFALNETNSLNLSQMKIDEEGCLYYDSDILNEKIFCGWQTSGNKFVVGLYEDFFNNRDDFIHLKADLDKSESLWIQAGTEPDQGLYVNLVDATAFTLGISDVNVSTISDAGAAIDKIKEALQIVSRHRSNFGALQNRMEHAYNVNMNTVENTQYAEAKIRDTNMAEEMVRFSNESIMQQAAEAMLAQANQVSQGVLQIIQ